jgi:subtilisin family serine protease
MKDLSRAGRCAALQRTARFVSAVSVAAFAVASCQDASLPTEPELTTDLDAITASVQQSGVGADDWIIVFKEGTKDPPGLAKKLVADHGGTIRYTYQHALSGFAGNIPPQAIDGIRRNPNVDFVEHDGVVTKTVASWGLDRIDQRALPLDNSFTPGGTGSGVDVWILDTGIDYGRTDEFGTRLDDTRDYDFVSNDADASDCDGHGTHVAGTVGSATYGVAKGVTIIAVRVLNCQGSGTYSGVIAGVDYVAGNMTGPAVANMSLSGGVSSSLNTAVRNAVNAGLVMAVAAGNDNTDACTRSPASAPEAITVGASTSSDARSSFSNYGSCVDLFAPGSGITSTVMGGGAQAWSGTSMASPHVAGAAALLLEPNPGWNASQVWSAMQGNATAGVISNVSGSPNLLLHVGDGANDPPPDPGCVADCPTAFVGWISSVTVRTAAGKKAGGTVSVQIVDEAGAPLSGVGVNGTWNVNNVQDYVSSSGTTGSDGIVVLSTSMIRLAETFEFCVTGLSIPGYEDGSAGECNGYGDPVGVDPPPPDPGAQPPSNLSVSKDLRGKTHRAELTWEGGGATVDVKLDGSTIATVSNSQSYTDNLGKTPSGSYPYQVCNAGSSDCTLIETISY